MPRFVRPLLLLLVAFQATSSWSQAHDRDAIRSSAMSEMSRYAMNTLKGDVGEVAGAWHSLVVDKLGGPVAATERATSLYGAGSLSASWEQTIHLGSPVILEHPSSAGRSIIAVVPSIRIAKGFPSDIEMETLYVLLPDEDGSAWKVVDSGCLTLEAIKGLFPEIDPSEFNQIERDNFRPVRSISLAGLPQTTSD